MSVSAQSEKKLREAMARLLAGTPLYTDGALTKENLAREAQVSHATVHRAVAVLADWDARVQRPVLRSVGEVRRDETIAEMAAKLREANSRTSELQGKLDALASVTANLYHENLELRRKLNEQRGRLIALPSRGQSGGIE